MQWYTIQLETIDGFADSEYLDRLAELVYDQDALVDALLGLNSDGSLTISFDVASDSPMDAVEKAHQSLDLLDKLVVAAGPLREPTSDEAEHGAALHRLAMKPVDQREAVYV